MRDLGVERVRFRRAAGTMRVIAAQPEGSWEPVGSLLPESAEDCAAVEARMLRGGHERLDLVFRSEVGLRFLCAVHSTLRGPGAGGLRRHELVVPELEVIADVLNLSRAMTYKNTAAELARGGSKLCVHNPGIPDYGREAWLACLAEEIDLSGTITGPDSGYPPAVYRDLADLSRHVTGVHGGGTARPAARGVLTALGATAAALGKPLEELKVAIQGLGGLGQPVAEELASRGTSLVVTDRDHRRIDAFLAGLTPGQRREAKVVAPYQILEVEADILAPCAVGSVIAARHVDSLACRAICGGANNQLVADSLQEELDIARRLMDVGILFVPDWLASAGGTIQGVLEYEGGGSCDPRVIQARLRRVCGWLVDTVLEESKRTTRTPLEIAVERVLGPAAGIRA